MKVYECENQLKKITDSYYIILKEYDSIIYKVSKLDKNNISNKDVYYILNSIYQIRKYLPRNILKDLESYFDCFDISDIDAIQSLIIKVKKIFNDNKFGDEMNAISKVKNKENHFERIYELYKFLYEYVYPNSYDLVNANVNDVFNACMKAKNEIWEYIISLELPTKPDYEV